jgi:hypothetical protein
MKRKQHKNINEQIYRIKDIMFLMEQSCSVPDCIEKLRDDGYTVLSSRDRGSKRMACEGKTDIINIVNMLKSDFSIPDTKIKVKWTADLGCFVLTQTDANLGGYNRLNLTVFEDGKFVLSQLLDNSIKIAYVGELDMEGKRFIDFKYKGKVSSTGSIGSGLPFQVKDASGVVKKVDARRNDVVNSGLNNGDDLMSNQVLQYDNQIIIPSHGSLSYGDTNLLLSKIKNN